MSNYIDKIKKDQTEFDIYAERAKKTIEGIDIEDLGTAASIPVLTEDNVAEIFEKKPQFIKYNDVIFTLTRNGENTLQYTWSSADEYVSDGVEISSNGAIEYFNKLFANAADIGTKLYKHTISFKDVGGTRQEGYIKKFSDGSIKSIGKIQTLEIISTIATPIAKNTFSSNLLNVYRSLKIANFTFDAGYGNYPEATITAIIYQGSIALEFAPTYFGFGGGPFSSDFDYGLVCNSDGGTKFEMTNTYFDSDTVTPL